MKPLTAVTQTFGLDNFEELSAASLMVAEAGGNSQPNGERKDYRCSLSL
jgi:hypothetical protein